MTEPDAEPRSEFKERTSRAAVLKALHNMIGDALDAEMKGDEAPIRKAMIVQFTENGNKSVEVELPGMGKVGTVTLPKNQDRIDVLDDKALFAWVAAWMPGEIETVKRVRPAFLGALKGRVIGDYDTGDVLDPTLAAENNGVAVKVAGMKARRGVGFGTPSVKLDSGQSDRIAGIVMGRTLLELTAAPEPQKATAVDSDGVVIIDAEVVEDMTPAELKAAKRPALREECRRLDLDDVGNVGELRKRIQARYDERAAAKAAGDRLAAMSDAMRGDS